MSELIFNTTIADGCFYVKAPGGNRISYGQITKMLRDIYEQMLEKMHGDDIIDNYNRPRVTMDEIFEIFKARGRFKRHKSPISTAKEKREAIRDIFISDIDLPQTSFVYPVEILALPVDYIMSVIDDPNHCGICVKPENYGRKMVFNMAEITRRGKGSINISRSTTHHRYIYEVRLHDIMERPTSIFIESNTDRMDRFMQDLDSSETANIVISLRDDDDLKTAHKHLLTIYKYERTDVT